MPTRDLSVEGLISKAVIFKVTPQRRTDHEGATLIMDSINEFTAEWVVGRWQQMEKGRRSLRRP